MKKIILLFSLLMLVFSCQQSDDDQLKPVTKNKWEDFEKSLSKEVFEFLNDSMGNNGKIICLRDETQEFLELFEYSEESKNYVIERVNLILNVLGKNNKNSPRFNIKDYLNEKEILLTNEFPGTQFSFGLSSFNARVTAERIDKEGILTGLNLGKADAFRHVYWNFLNVRNANIGQYLTKLFTDAHEMYNRDPALDREMDLRNNAVGRRLAGEYNGGSTSGELETFIIKAINDGEAVYVKGAELVSTNK